MNPILEICGNHIIWRRRLRAEKNGWSRPLDKLPGKKRLVLQGSFGRHVDFDSLAIPERARKFIWFFLLFLVSLRFYFVRELVAGLLLITALTFAVSLPALVLFAVYKAGQHLNQRERGRRVTMKTSQDPIPMMSVSDLQLEELLCRLAVNQRRSEIVPNDLQQPSEAGLFLIGELPRQAS